jgi:N-glycosylase/DNA lyase
MTSYIAQNHNITFTTDYFDIAQIVDSGQLFRFRFEDPYYIGIAHGREIRIRQTGSSEFTIYNLDEPEFKSLWYRYFAFDEDYKRFSAEINTDPYIRAAISYGRGLRILRQDPFEVLISFILSQNNNIPRIQKAVASLSFSCGKPIGENLYAFPTADEIVQFGLERLSTLKFGYRDRYVYEVACAVEDGRLDLTSLTDMPTEEARKVLMGQLGIGQKVADCILLFGYARYEVCPMDVWIRRILSEHYQMKTLSEAKAFVFKTWGEKSGIAQQYLYYYERNNH